jgi:hypothetical protein
MKRYALQLLLLAVFTSSAAWGQINCATGSASTKLVCEFPVSTGVLANSTALGGSSSLSAQGNATGVATALNVAIATQLSQLPLAGASAGTVLTYKNGVPETFNNLGPILVDRAQTIGRNRFFWGFTASQYVFTNIDSQSLRSLPFSYYRTACQAGSTSCSPSNAVSTTYTSEITSATFVVNQFVIVGTAGVTPKLDLSLIVPISRVSVGAAVPASTSTNYVVSSNNSYFSAAGPTSSNGGSASGVGDVEVGVKYALYVGERTTLSTGAIFRVPSGVAENFLGSGAWGFNPFLAYSYLSKVSPHAKIGFQWNTASELNNPTYTNPIYSTTGALESQPNAPLPGGVQYDIGADWAASKRVTVAADFLGNQYLNTYRLSPSNSCVLTASSGQCTLSVPTTTLQSSSYSISDLSTGLKWNPAKSLVFSANLLTQLNNNGMRARPTPLLGIGYKF